MYVFVEAPMGRAELTGRLLWTLVKAAPGYDPATMDNQIRQQVIKDIKQKAAFDNAVEAAKALQAKVQQGQDLQKLAKDDGLEVEDSGFISRIEARYGQRPTPGKIPGFEDGDVLTRRLPGANYSDLTQQVMKETFTVVPKPGEQATTSPATGPAAPSVTRSTTFPATQSQPSTMPGASSVTIVPMRWSNQVAVVQRLDYRPAVLGKYLEPGTIMFPFEIDRKTLKEAKTAEARQRSVLKWFAYGDVKSRTGYISETQEKQPPQ
jgi:hypothetical protein